MADGLGPDEEKVKAVEQSPVLIEISRLGRVLGIVGYCHHFICRFGDIAAPLFEFLQTDTKVKWKQSCTKACQMLKDSLIKAPVMCCPHFDQPFILYN